MRYASGHKEQTRAKIVKAAGKVFRRDGFHAAGVDKVMEEAGLTAGGFYAHFASKEALLAASLQPTSADVVGMREKELEGVASHAWLEAFIERYLAIRHMTNTEEGCPLPALASEIARAGEPVKASFEAVVRGFAARLMEGAGTKLTENQALAIVALCVGGLVVARSVKDHAFGEQILVSCRQLVSASLAANPTIDASAKARQRRGK